MPPWIQLLGLPLIGTIVGSVVTWLFNERAAKRREKAARSERLLFENLAKRRAVYEKLYQDVTVLERYYEPYRSGSSAYNEQKAPADFAPLQTLEEFRIQLGTGDLWLDAPTRAGCQDVLDAGDPGLLLARQIADTRNMAMGSSREERSKEQLNEVVALVRETLNPMFSSSVSSHVESVLVQISKLKAVMRQSLGLDSLDREVAAAIAQSNAMSRTS